MHFNGKLDAAFKIIYNYYVTGTSLSGTRKGVITFKKGKRTLQRKI